MTTPVVGYQVALNLAGRQRMLNQRLMKETFAAELGQPVDRAATIALLRGTCVALAEGGVAVRVPGANPVRVQLQPPPTATLARLFASQLSLIDQQIAAVEGGEIGTILNIGSELHTVANQACTELTAYLASTEQHYQAEVDALHAAIRAGELRSRGRVDGLSPRFQASMRQINEMVDDLLAPINGVQSALQALSEGDLSQYIEQQYEGDHAALRDSLHTGLDRLNEMLGEVKTTAEEVSRDAQDIAASSDTLSGGAARQAAGEN
jgi:methyl-accepting chemotaxis protein